jgi:ribosome maturation factor RimP
MTETIEKIYALIEPLLDETDIFIVSIKIKPTNNVKVFLDADGGFSIDKSISVNRKLYALIDASAMFPEGDFSLEVSSPGVDEPLLQLRQYKKNVGRLVLVTDNADKEFIGTLTAVTDDGVTLVLKKKPKEKEALTVEMPFADIKKTVVQVVF